VGDTVISSRNADIKPGNSLPLRYIPLGTTVHNIELKINGGAQLVRSAGGGAQVMAKEGDWGTAPAALGRGPRVHLDCRATVGQVGNVEHNSVHVGKAGRSRWLGFGRTTAASP
jgi:large subunit ribosomal protein L2